MQKIYKIKEILKRDLKGKIPKIYSLFNDNITNNLLKDVPVVPQKHTVFRISCPKHIPEMPLTSDFTTGVYWRPEGKEYLAGSPLSVFDAEDLEPAWNDFEELVWPALAKRIPAFEELKVTGGRAGYYDCNKLDNNAVV